MSKHVQAFINKGEAEAPNKKCDYYREQANSKMTYLNKCKSVFKIIHKNDVSHDCIAVNR